MVLDRPGVLAKIASVLGRHNISIAQVWQRSRDFKNTVPIFLLTHGAQEKNLVKAVAEIDKLSVVKGKTFYLRIED
jgi:homoserine dehydrogenase